MPQKKGRGGLIALVVFLLLIAGGGGWLLLRWRRIAGERAKWRPVLASLGPSIGEGLRQLQDIEPNIRMTYASIRGEVLIWNVNDERVQHAAAAAGREAQDPGGGYTVLVVRKQTEKTGLYRQSGPLGHSSGDLVANMDQYTLTVVVLDPASRSMISAHKIWGSPPPSVTDVNNGFCGPDDVGEKFETWLRSSLR